MFKVPTFCEAVCEELVPQAYLNFSCSNLEGGEENKSNAWVLCWGFVGGCVGKHKVMNAAHKSEFCLSLLNGRFQSTLCFNHFTFIPFISLHASRTDIKTNMEYKFKLEDDVLGVL